MAGGGLRDRHVDDEQGRHGELATREHDLDASLIATARAPRHNDVGGKSELLHVPTTRSLRCMLAWIQTASENNNISPHLRA